jgi:succinate dehydrogenase/fumarate reductase flavoprotein subunit
MKRREFIQSSLATGLTLSSLQGISENENSSITENLKTDIAGEFDTIVCGGGPAGFAAALSSARAGAKTCLIELQGFLGGIWTAGMLSHIIDYRNKEGIIKEVVNNVRLHNTQIYPHLFDPEAMKVILDDMCTHENIFIQLYTRVVHVIKDDNRITGVVTESTSGRQAWKAKVVIDATGNGDVAALAGCQFEVGHPETGKVQPMTLKAVVSGLNYEDIKGEFISAGGVSVPEQKENFRNEINSVGESPSYSMPTLIALRPDLFAVMMNHEYNVSALDALEMTKASIQARKEINVIVRKLRNKGGVWKNMQLVATAPHIGVREARRILGHYYVTREDISKGAEFDDAVCKVTYWTDIHSVDPGKGKAYDDGGIKSKPYDIPLRALIAKDVDGLLMAGRCISGDFFAHSSYRVTGNSVPMGEAAGKLAAYASLNNELPHKVPYKVVL